MKKVSILLIAILLIPVQFAISQEDETPFKRKTKRDPKEFLPQRGDWGIGISATPFFMYAGNLFNSNGNANAPGLQFTSQYPGSIYVKYRKSSRTSYRGIVTIGVGSEENKITNTSDSSDTPHLLKTSSLALGVIFGIEKNRTIGRVSGIYGWQVGVHKTPFQNGSQIGKFEYTDQNDIERSLEEYGGNTISFSANGFAGIEFYLLPRVALAGEVGLGFEYYKQYERYRKQGTSDAEIIDNGATGFSLKPVASGEISIFLYF